MSDNSINIPAIEVRSTVVVIQHASEPLPASNGGVGVVIMLFLSALGIFSLVSIQSKP